MENFNYCNPVKIVFGKGTIGQIDKLIEPDAKVLLTYGGGSIKTNGVYKQVRGALKGRKVVEFGGIEPNPSIETCSKAVELGQREKVNFILAVGGGSVIDGSKFIAAAIPFKNKNLWQIIEKGSGVIKSALPIGVVLTLPATGSEMNNISVMSRNATLEKKAFRSEYSFPKFSILDPETTYSLDRRQLRNGLVDAFVHVCEQYATKNSNAHLQDRHAEGIFKTLVQIAPVVMSGKKDYDTRATFMWCATQALNGLTACGTIGDWSTHGIGHVLTAFFGLAHAESIAIVLPAVWKYELAGKTDKLAMLAENVWGIKKGSRKQKAAAAIERTVKFFHSVGMPTKLSNYDITKKDITKVIARFKQTGLVLGENHDIGAKAVEKILKICL